jgi:hypothetical protein
VQASGDAMKYIRENGAPQDIKAGYRSISPAFALRATSPFTGWTDFLIVLPALRPVSVSRKIS